MQITKRYLKVPVSRYVQNKDLIFSDENGVFMDYKIQLCTKEPEFWFYIDMRFALGKEYTFKTEPHVNYQPEFTDRIPDNANLYHEKFRPSAHFSGAYGWINDPNGLVYYNGIYHMFFQHNPGGPLWHNMHWGHAESRDLLHWEEKEPALFPDRMGVMYSGSAIIDRQNVSGLKENDNDVILFYYTACNAAGMKLSEGSETSQCLAYSTDGGKTLKKYSRNPVVPHIVSYNRDPKVVYVPEENCYCMALYLCEDEFAILSSENLLDWKQIQTFRIPEENECPDFYPLVSDKGSRYWIFSGAHDRFLIGRIENGKFRPVQPVQQLNYGDMAYAAQTYSGLPDDTRIRLSWNRSESPESYFNSSMCTPHQIGLKEEADGQLFVTIRPIGALKTIESACSPDNLPGKAHDITIQLNLSQNAEIQFSLLGFSFSVSAQEHRIRTGDFTMPLFDRNGAVTVRLISDTTSVEVYSGEGKAFGVYANIADDSLNYLDYQIISGTADVKVSACAIEDIWK